MNYYNMPEKDKKVRSILNQHRPNSCVGDSSSKAIFDASGHKVWIKDIRTGKRIVAFS